MRVGVLYTGGKDSHLALAIARDYFEVSCLITLYSENEESYMFHTPGINIVEVHSKLMDIPLCIGKTKGEKEKELLDLERTIKKAIELYGIKGIVTGANRSIYQNTRIQRICKRLDIWSFNPLWLMPEEELVEELLNRSIKALIIAVGAWPLDDKVLGRELDKDMITLLKQWKEKYQISLIGEGGEFETMVIDSPLFKKKIELEYDKIYENYSGRIQIKSIKTVDK